MPHPDHARLVLLAHERLHDASLDPGAWPSVPAKCVLAFRLLCRERADERAPVRGDRIAEGIRVSIASVGVQLNLLAALLSHYAPGVQLRRRRIENRGWGYWIDLGEPSPSAVEQLALDLALERSSLQSATPTQALSAA